jgi:dihydroorotase
MELVIHGERSNQTMSDEDLAFIEQIVETLNDHFPHLD